MVEYLGYYLIKWLRQVPSYFHIFSKVNSKNMSSLEVNTDLDPLPFMIHLFFLSDYFLLKTAPVFFTPWLNKSSNNLVNIYYFFLFGKHSFLLVFIYLVD